jgi:hypothetical protein
MSAEIHDGGATTLPSHPPAVCAVPQRVHTRTMRRRAKRTPPRRSKRNLARRSADSVAFEMKGVRFAATGESARHVSTAAAAGLAVVAVGVAAGLYNRMSRS